MGFTPLGERVVVERLEGEKESGGIHIPDAHQRESQRYRVVMLGTGIEPGTIRRGDIVVLPKVGGADIIIEDELYSIFFADQILTVETAICSA